MKKFLTLLLILIIATFTFTGCYETNENGNEVHKVNDQVTFVRVMHDYSDCFSIFIHKETKVMYVAYYGGGGMSVMLDAQGKPLIWRGNL